MRHRVGREHEEELRAERMRQPAVRDEGHAGWAAKIQRTLGNQAMVRMLARTKTKRVGDQKVEYATSEAEAVALCKEHCQAHEMNWDTDISAAAMGTILHHAQTPVIDKSPAGLPSAYGLILAERREEDQLAAKGERQAQIAGDYNKLRTRLTRNAILTKCVESMTATYVAGAARLENHELSGTYTRAEIKTAVRAWKAIDPEALGLTVMTNPHGYSVGPKKEQVGDTLARRGAQGNIIAVWAGHRINMHINPSD